MAPTYYIHRQHIIYINRQQKYPYIPGRRPKRLRNTPELFYRRSSTPTKGARWPGEEVPLESYKPKLCRTDHKSCWTCNTERLSGRVPRRRCTLGSRRASVFRTPLPPGRRRLPKIIRYCHDIMSEGSVRVDSGFDFFLTRGNLHIMFLISHCEVEYFLENLDV